MAQRLSLDEIRDRTYKDRDAWWTVWLVDPLAARLVRLVAPYRWITPNLLTALGVPVRPGRRGLFRAGRTAGGWSPARCCST